MPPRSDRTSPTQLARIAFIPSAHAASLWILGHNQIDHGFTNLNGRDYVWEPMSPAEYAVASAGRRASIGSVAAIRGAAVLSGRHVVEEEFSADRARGALRRWRHHVFDSVFVVLGQDGMIAALIATGRTLDPAKSLWLIVVLGWVLPFLVWNWLIDIVMYVHHTHPTIPWFDDRTKWKAARAALFGTAHVRLRQPIHLFIWIRAFRSTMLRRRRSNCDDLRTVFLFLSSDWGRISASPGTVSFSILSAAAGRNLMNDPPRAAALRSVKPF